MDTNSLSNRYSLRLHDLPIIDNIDDFSNITRLSKGLIYRMASRSEYYYRICTIPKKSGGERILACPSATLKAVQGWILHTILNPLHVSDVCKGFVRKKSILHNAIPHIRANAVMSMDIDNFFPSISAKRIYWVFTSAGYGRTAAGLLTSLTTYKGALPQGAPTSPKLSNLVCHRMDARISGYTGKCGIIYTRYADDLTFSAFRPEVLCHSKSFIEMIIEDEGFLLNTKKFRIAGPSRCRRVTGLVLGSEGVGIGRKKYRDIRVKLHKLSQEDKDKVESHTINHIRGWLSFIKGVDPNRYDMLRTYIGKLQIGELLGIT